MDIQLLQNFKKLINQQYDEMVISQIEQYKCEVEQLNELLVNTTSLIKEKQELIGDLENQVADNKFDESNFNNVSIISNLNKQIQELSSKNELLETSLRIRCESKTEVLESPTEEPEPEAVVEEEAEVEVAEEEAVVEAEAEVEAEVVVEEAAVEEEAEVEEEEEEEEVEVTEIEYKDKQYYIQDSIMYNKKKNGDMGKEVGKIVNGKPKLNKKKKKTNDSS
jgi:hypothetical protein